MLDLRSFEGLSLDTTSRGALCCSVQVSPHSGFSSCRARALGTGSCAAWTWLFLGMWGLPGPESKLCPLHWQIDSYPLHHQGSPLKGFLLPSPHFFFKFLLRWKSHNMKITIVKWITQRHFVLQLLYQHHLCPVQNASSSQKETQGLLLLSCFSRVRLCATP